MDVTFKLATNFKGIIDILSGLVDTLTMQYTNDSINIQTMDSSHISLLNIVMRRDQFLVYYVVSSGLISFNVSSFKPLLKSMKEGDHLRLRHKTGNDEIDAILIDGDRKNKYLIKLMDIDSEMINMDNEMEHDVFIMTGKAAISRILTDIKHVESSDTTFMVDGEKIVIETKNENCSLKIKPTPEIMKVMSSPEEKVCVPFASRYIQQIQKMLAISKPRINLKLDKECPMLIEMIIRTDDPNETATIQKTHSTMKYYLAPKLVDSE